MECVYAWSEKNLISEVDDSALFCGVEEVDNMVLHGSHFLLSHLGNVKEPEASENWLKT